MMRPAPFLAALLLSACADLPEVSSAVDPSDGSITWPQLVPLGPVLQDLDTTPAVRPQDLAARVARLRARARALQAAQL